MIAARWARVRAIGVAVLVISTTLPACGPSGGQSDGGSEAGGAVAYACVRTYVDHLSELPVIQTERFVRAADGRSGVELLALNGQTLDQIVEPALHAAFLRLQARFTTGLGNLVATWRDFSVRNQALFEDNYEWSQVSASKYVAGRDCTVAEVRPDFPDRPSYRVWADKETHIILKALEYTPDGVLASEMEVTSLDLDPVLTEDDLADLSYVEQAEASEGEIEGFVNFESFEPSYLPAGFELRSTRIAQVAGFPISVHTWGDGVVELMLVQYAALIQDPNGVTEDFPEGAFSAVAIERNGTIYDGTFFVDGTQVHVLGKLDLGELQTVMESLVPAE